jgi:IS5 family transposase
MHQTKKGNQWFFGMKAHIGADAGTGYVHTVTATAANVHDLDEAVHLVRADDEVVYADAGYQGAAKRPEIAENEDLSRITWQVAPRKGVLKTMTDHDRVLASRQASVRAKVEHPFLIVKRDFGFTKTRYRGIAPKTGVAAEPPQRHRKRSQPRGPEGDPVGVRLVDDPGQPPGVVRPRQRARGPG